jgi:hypothetical protein
MEKQAVHELKPESIDQCADRMNITGEIEKISIKVVW